MNIPDFKIQQYGNSKKYNLNKVLIPIRITIISNTNVVMFYVIINRNSKVPTICGNQILFILPKKDYQYTYGKVCHKIYIIFSARYV